MKYGTFKIYPDKSKWFYKVCIFHSKRSMYNFREDLVKEGANKMRKPYEFLACCSTFRHKKEKYQYGVLLFTVNSSSKSGVVSHEICHATTYWWKYAVKHKWGRILKGGSREDEKHAHLLGNMVRQYWINWYNLMAKLSKKPRVDKVKKAKKRV